MFYFTSARSQKKIQRNLIYNVLLFYNFLQFINGLYVGVLLLFYCYLKETHCRKVIHTKTDISVRKYNEWG